jgi:lipid II:glycine glycyltransferase (peptidoglycan interpeptide bridge formation enzyme)
VTAEDTVGYAPHGPDIPVPTEAQGPFLEEIAERLRPRVPRSCRFLRFDLLWSSPYLGTDQWSEPPEPRVREMRMNFGCREWSLRKAPTDLQPPDTVVLDLEPPVEELLQGMHPKHRYCIRAAARRGVAVRAGTAGDLAQWHRIHCETAERRGIPAEPLLYFEKLLRAAECHDPEVRLYLASADGELLSGSIFAFLETAAYYLFSAASPAGRRRFASFAVMWQAIQDARDRGCRILDLMGIPPDNRPGHPMHGLYCFKTRFGGTIHHRRGCWDYPFDEHRYPLLAFAADARGAYHA